MPKRKRHHVSTRITSKMPRLERLYKHVLSSELKQGRPTKVAVRIAAAVVNKVRANEARKGIRRLIRSGGGRQQFYPGKYAAAKRRARRRRR